MAHPQSQGCVENINGKISRLLHQSFRLYKSQSGSKWFIESALGTLVANHNRSKHTVTKESPINLVQSKDQAYHEAIKQRVLDYYQPQIKKSKAKISDKLHKGTKAYIIKEVKVTVKKAAGHSKKKVHIQINRKNTS